MRQDLLGKTSFRTFHDPVSSLANNMVIGP
jgi:hypothetical protein